MTDRTKIYESIRAILLAYVKTDKKISEETNIVADLEIDSVDVFDMIMEVEDAHDISISMETISTTHTVGELTDVVERLILDKRKA